MITIGWDGYYADEPVDRKYECDRYNTWDDTESSCEVVKSAMHGSVYYAACEYHNKKSGEHKIFGSVCLTQVDRSEGDIYGCNFWIKAIDESMGPCYYDCPIGILNLLTETDNEYALHWRKLCRERMTRENRKKNTLQRLPVGSVIAFVTGGEKHYAEKCAPAYQFKKSWWYVRQNGTYIRQKSIPDNFEIVKKGAAPA